MRLFSTFATVACLGVLVPLAASVPSRRQAPRAAKAPAADATAKIVAASQAFLATLDAAGKAKVQLAYAAPEKSTGWSNLPIGMVPRNGIRMGDLTPAQRTAAMAVLAAAFSQDGYRKVTETVMGDETLRTNAGGGAGSRIQFGKDEVLPGLPRHALHHRAVDAAVRRSPPGDQPDAGRAARRRWRRACRRPAGPVHLRRPRRSVRSARRTTRPSR